MGRVVGIGLIIAVVTFFYASGVLDLLLGPRAGEANGRTIMALAITGGIMWMIFVRKR